MAYPETLSELTNYPKALSHASGGGGFALKSISFTNTTEAEAVIYRCINAEGKYIIVDPSSESDDLLKVPSGETVTVYYPEPSADSEWTMYAASRAEITLQTSASGITAEGEELTITAEAPDGATVTINTNNTNGAE